MASTTFKPRQYICANPIAPSCRKGFVSLTRYTEHKRTMHDPLRRNQARRNLNPRLQHPKDDDVDEANAESRDSEHNAPPKGAYYIPHPVLNGKSNIMCQYKKVRMVYMLI